MSRMTVEWPTTFLIMAAALAIAGLVWLRTRPSEFVYVEDDGSIRELTPDELGYLARTFLPNDGGRPYIKARYEQKTPDGGLAGYLARRKVPRGRSVKVA